MLQSSKVLSEIFTPFYLPIVGMLILFVFSYLALLPWTYKALVILVVWLFTIILPKLFIHIYMKYQRWSILKLISREGRMVPYAISIASYFTGFYVMNMLHFPHFMSAIVVAALFLQIICAITNIWFKISTHTAAIGGITGAVMAFAEIFAFNPLWWMSVTIILAGLVGTGRMLLRQHSLHQVVYGYLIGVATAFATIMIV